MRREFRTSWILSVITVVLMVAASAVGLLWRDVYQDNEWIKLAWLGNDLVTLLVAAPALGCSSFGRRGGTCSALS